MQNKKVGFFTRIKKSIFKFDEYEKFIEESLGKAFKYFFKLMLVLSLLVSIALICNFNSNFKRIKLAIQNELPEFEIKDGILEIKEDEKMEYYFEDYNFQFVMDQTQEVYTEDSYDNSITMLQKSMFIKVDNYTQEIGYNDIGDISKQIILEGLKGKYWIVVYIIMFFIMILFSFITYSTVIFFDIVTLSILGLIINLFIRTKFKYKDLVKISIYSMTLPILLITLYIVANVLFGTTIKIFGLACDAISYIYLITVMLMMKSDAIKNSQELQDLREEQKKVKEELEREKQEEKEKQERKEQEEKERKKEKDKPKETPQTDNG